MDPGRPDLQVPPIHQIHHTLDSSNIIKENQTTHGKKMAEANNRTTNQNNHKLKICDQAHLRKRQLDSPMKAAIGFNQKMMGNYGRK